MDGREFLKYIQFNLRQFLVFGFDLTALFPGTAAYFTIGGGSWKKVLKTPASL